MIDGKTIIVTGAASGIGKDTVPYLIELGATVVAFDITDPRETATQSPFLRTYAGDVRSALAWNEVVDLAVSAFGKVDGLANIAGIVRPSDAVLEGKDDVWRDTIDVNLHGPWLGMRAVLPLMCAQGAGHIVNVSSAAGLDGMPNLAAYSASKGGVNALTRQAAVEYAPRGVRINAICPGGVLTPILESAGPQPAPDFIPARRVGVTKDIAAGIAFLLSDLSDYIVGAIIPIDGGLTAALPTPV